MKSTIISILLMALQSTGMSNDLAQGKNRIAIENEFIRVVVDQDGGVCRETYYVKKGKSWIEILQSGSSLRPDPIIRGNGEVVPLRSASVSKGSGKTQIVIVRPAPGEGVTLKSIELHKGERWARVTFAYRTGGNLRLESFWSTYSFVPGGKRYAAYKPLDFVWTPQLRPEPEHIIADHAFRSPALMLQKDGYFASLVPVLSDVDGRGRKIRTVADLQVETADQPFFSIGLQNWIPEPYRFRNTHVYYVAPDSLAPVMGDTTVTMNYLLFLRSDAPKREGFRDVVRYHWMTSGAANTQRPAGPQSEPFSSYIQKAWYQFVPQVALDTQYHGVPVTLLRQARLAWSNKLPKSADNDSWFNVWFNALRTAYGMYLHGKTVDDQHLIRQATQVLNLALLAPQQKGIAPSIFYIDSAGGHWVADHAWGGIDDGRNLPAFHNAWTCYWLLQWIDLEPERKTEILRFTRAFADFLVLKQHRNGVIPSWYDPTTLEPVETFRDENAETAGAALFLAEFYSRTKGTKYLRGAERAMQYMFKSVVPERKWFDFETFFSCSRKPLGFFDSYTQQNPQNTLSMHQAAEACYELFRLTGKTEYKDRGVAIVDYLCLYQQVWSPRWLSRELFGGFGVQNTDAEWSDSRQGYFAVTLMKYYELTGQKEYFERGVAALRSMFSLFESPTSPRTAENYGHSGYDQPAGVTGLHWGTGSSVVSIHLITRRFGDAYVDVKGKWGVGIDGCRIPTVTIAGTEIHVEVVDNLVKARTIKLKFGNVAKSHYEIIVNNKPLGRVSAAMLRGGIDVAL
ncbi:MAG: hypothetical protein NTU47_00395 [Ignavibacteriales bacterium]|nr:hypothetical protein [Ignavibacteriales bacterium]